MNFNAKDAKVFAKSAKKNSFAYLCGHLRVLCVSMSSARAIADQSGGVGHHVTAEVGIDEAIARGVEIVRRLDAIVRTKYANNPMVLAEWTRAKHVERGPRRQRPANPPPPPTLAP